MLIAGLDNYGPTKIAERVTELVALKSIAICWPFVVMVFVILSSP